LQIFKENNLGLLAIRDKANFLNKTRQIQPNFNQFFLSRWEMHSKNFVWICLVFLELSCWQTMRQTHIHTYKPRWLHNLLAEVITGKNADISKNWWTKWRYSSPQTKGARKSSFCLSFNHFITFVLFLYAILKIYAVSFINVSQALITKFGRMMDEAWWGRRPSEKGKFSVSELVRPNFVI
jgi:hypothetical protein